MGVQDPEIRSESAEYKAVFILGFLGHRVSESRLPSQNAVYLLQIWKKESDGITFFAGWVEEFPRIYFFRKRVLPVKLSLVKGFIFL